MRADIYDLSPRDDFGLSSRHAHFNTGIVDRLLVSGLIPFDQMRTVPLPLRHALLAPVARNPYLSMSRLSRALHRALTSHPAVNRTACRRRIEAVC